MAALKKSEFRPARSRLPLSRGDTVRITRELQDLTQAELSEASGIPQPTISAIEKGRVTLGIDRAEKLARALKVHPAVLLFPQWELEQKPRRAAG
jgi:transcriptional regulator with XRE-family HTH domain